MGNELNMLLKAKVVKLKVELDYRGSKLPAQVNAITRFLKDKPVKLKIKFDVTQKALNAQLKAVNTKILTNKSIKPVKIRVELDKDSTGRIKQQFDQISRAITEFNKKYSKQVKDMENNKKRADRAVLVGGNVSTSAPVQNFNNIKQYTKQLEHAEKILRSKLPSGQNGLFSSVQMKDAKGNLQGFIASLTKASGVVEQVHYKWNAKKETFSPISRKTLDNSQKSLQETSIALKALHTQIKTLEKGTGKSNLFKEYEAISERMKNGTMNGSAIKNLQNMIKEEQNLQKYVDKTNKEYAEQQALIRKITKARDADFKATADVSRRKQYNNLLGDVKKQRRDLKLVKSDLESINNVVDISNRKEKELNANTKKRLAVMQQLRVEANKSVSSDKTSQKLLREITLMTRRAKTATDYIAIQKKMNQLQVSNYNDAQISKSIAMQDKIQKHLRTLVNTGRMTAQQFDKAIQQLPKTASRGNADLDRQLKVLTRTVSRNADKMKAEANKMKTIFAGGSVQADGFKKLVGSGNIDAIQKSLGAQLKGTVQAIDIAHNKTDRYGNAITEMKVKMQSAGKQAQTYTMQMNRATGALSQVGSGLQFNANRNLGVFEQLRVAMSRVPIWMTAMTAFYGSIRIVRSAVNEIMEVDRALTEIRRVASAGINIDTMFRGSVELSKELGNNVHDILASVAELSRTFGKMNERQLLSITRTGTLMANVSDLNAQEAVQTLVGTMNAFNIEAEESIRIVDSLNEVDNNFAISTKQLSEGLSKSASTARTFGVSMEESVGHITAIGSVTMESGRLIGNSLKTIYSRVTTLGASEEILSSVGIAVKQIGENGEEVRPVNDILKDLALRWNTISKSQQQNIAVTVAGRYQLSRFLALMNNYDTALDATSTAVYSQGSAMRENAEYMKSFEARVNQMKNGWTELTDVIGDAILKSSMMEIIRLFTSLTAVGIKVVDTVGILPVLLGGLAVVLLKMKVFSTWTSSMVRGMTAVSQAYIWTAQKATMLGTAMSRASAVGSMSMGMLRARVVAAMTGISAAFTMATTAVMKFTVAFRTMLASTIIGVAFVALGFAIEKLMKVYNEKKQKEEELLLLNQKMINGYREHRDGMDTLVAKYDELRNTSARTAEEEREYLGLQKQLAEQIPTTVAYIDANGNAHMKTTVQIEREIEAVKELSIQEAKLTNAKFHENMEKKSESYMKVIENIEELNKKQKELEENDGKNAWVNGRVGTDNMWDALLSTNPYLDNGVHIQQNKVDVMMAEAEKTEAIQKTIQAVQGQTVAYFESQNKMTALGDEQQAIIESFIGYNEQMLRHADTPEKFEQAYRDLFEIGVEVGEVFVEAYDIMSKDIGDDPLALAQLKKDLGEVATSIPETFYQLEDEFGKPIRSLDEVKEGIKEIINVSQHVSDGNGDWDGLTERLEKAGLSADQAQGFLANLANEHSNAELKAIAQAQGVDELTGSIEDLNEKAMEAIDLTKSLFGYSGTELAGLQSHLQMMHLMVDTMGEAGKETDGYKDSQQALVDFLGITTEELEKNEHKYYDIIEALGEISLSDYDPSQSWSKFIDSQEIDDKMKEVLKSWDGSKDILTGEQSEMISKNAEVKKSVDEINDVFEKEIETPSAVKAMRDIQDEAKDTRNVFEKFGDSFTNTWRGWIDGLQSWEDSISEWYSNSVESVADTLRGWGDAIKNFFSTDDSSPIAGFNKWGEDITDWFTGVPDTIRELMSDWGEAIDDSMPEFTLQGFVDWGTSIGDWFKDQHEENKEFYGGWWDEFVQDLKDMPDKIREQMAEWKVAFEDFLGKGSDIGEKISQWFEDNVPTWDEIKDRINTKLEPIKDAIKNFWDSGEERGDKIDNWFVENVPTWEQVKESISTKTDEISEKIRNFWDSGKERGNAIDNWFVDSVPTWEQVKEGVSKKFNDIVKEIKKSFENMGEDIDSAGAGEDIGENIVKGAMKGYSENEKDLLTIISRTILMLPLYVIAGTGILLFGLGREIVRFISSGMAENRNKKDFIDSPVGKLVTWIDDSLSPHRDSFVNWGKDMVNNMAEGIRNKNEQIAFAWEGIKAIGRTKMTEMIADITLLASKLPGKIGGAIGRAKDDAKRGITLMVADMASSIVTGMNTIIKIINKVFGYMNIDSLSLLSAPSSGGRTAPKGMGMGVQAYAKGTKDKAHQGGKALVGEEGQELAHIPNKGLTLLGQRGAEILDLPKGSSVLPHKQTQQMLQSYNFPAYALGVGDFFKDVKDTGMGYISKGKGYAGNILQSGLDVFSGAQSAIGDLFDKFSNTPRKIIETLLSGMSNINGHSGLSGDMFKGAVSTVKSKAIDFTAKKIKDVFGSGGNVSPNFNGSRMTSPFGWRTHPIFGGKSFHSGVDYANALGTPIGSQTGGKVTFSGASGNGFGNLVKIKNGSFEYFYAHLQNTLARLGSMVKKGDLIGKMGSTGDSTGSHVHYEVRQNGKAIAPKGFEIGGKVSKEQIIRVGEGDKEEMIIPLEQHKDRAVGLWKEAGERLGQFQYFAKGGTVSGSGSSYKVKYGDTMSELAVQFKTTVKNLMKLNSNIKDSNKIQVGQVLKLSSASNASAPKTNTSKTSSYTIKYGDTLSELAVKFKTTVKHLMSLNKNIKNADKIQQGQKINVTGGSSSSAKKPAPKPFSIPLTAEQNVSKWQSQIALTEQQMKKITEHSDSYRNKMREIVTFETRSLKYQKQILTTAEKRQKVLLNAMSKSPKKKNEKQQEQYDKWKDEYDSNIEKIQGLKVEIEGLTNTIQEKTLAVFTNLVDGIMSRAENRFTQFAKNIDDIDFKIQVAELTEPENVEKRLELQAERAVQVKEQQNEVLQLVKEIEKNYSKVVKANGANSEQAKRWKEELDAINEKYEDITIEALQAEKAVKDARQEIADKGIDQLKKYYGKVKDLATEAIDAEKEQLQKAHDEKMKLYDKESERISTLYDEKLQAMDKEKSDTEYLEQLNEKNANKAELLNKISVLSRDTSVEGRKKVAELQKELADVNKDITDVQKERQDSILREALEEQKQAQLDAIEAKKKIEEEVLQFGADMEDNGVGGLVALEAEKEAIAKKYDDLINNEKHWADVRDSYTKGSFEKLNAELKAMYANVDAMNSGNFGVISDSFDNLSDSAKAKMVSNNEQDIANTQGQNDELKKEVEASQSANTNTTAKQGRLLTGFYKAKASAEKTKKIIEKDYSGKNTKLVSVKEGWKVQADFSSSERATSVRDRLRERKILSVGHVSSFETGGYTGQWGKAGKLAVLHEKELVLKKDDTKNILDATKVIQGVSRILPQVKRSSLSDKFATASGMNINNHYALTVNIDNLNGDKNGAETVAKTVMKGLKKMGKR